MIVQASPARKRDIGLQLRQQAKLARNEDQTESSQDATVIYGNGIPGNEAIVESYEFNKDDDGNYNFK